MSRTLKALVSILCSVCIVVIGICVYWSIANWSKIYGEPAGNGLYTKEDLDNAYQDGFNDGKSDERPSGDNDEYYESLISDYLINIGNLNNEVSSLRDDKVSLTNQINSLTREKNEYSSRVSSLEKEKERLTGQVQDLESKNAENKTTITNLNSNIADLKDRINTLKSDSEKNGNEIESLNREIETLNNQKANLEEENLQNSERIKSLNEQVNGLTSQIDGYQMQIGMKNSEITSLNSHIGDLESLINGYTTEIDELNARVLELEDQLDSVKLVAMFKYEGSFYNVLFVKKNNTVSIDEDPLKNDPSKVFNGWTVDGEEVDLSTYRITENTTFVASITYRSKITFYVGDSIYKTAKYIDRNTKVPSELIPTNPTKYGSEFEGWSLDEKTVIDLTDYVVFEDTIFKAVFSEISTEETA